MNSVSNSPETLNAITNILKTNKDISACLTNCSNNGLCTLDSNQNFVCSCFEFYSGKSCEKDLRPCSSYPCLKNGTCINIINGSSYEFECKCKYPYYSKYCELKINICQNITCSNQGVCYLNDTQPLCRCFNGYYGINCEEISQELARIKLISNISGYLAITCIVVFLSFFVIMDISKFFAFLFDKDRLNKRKVIKKKNKIKPLIKKKITYEDYIDLPDE